MFKKIIFSSICILASMGMNAQELANFMGRARIVSPEIGEREVTFRISAPYADTVQISGAFLPTQEMETSFGTMNVPVNQNLTKDGNGVWSITIPTPEPELYTYSFIVDGLSVNDPNNIFQQRDGRRYLSVLLIPGELTENYYEADQRGNLEQVWYDSPTLEMNRRMFVYTPYGYETSNKSYPVLYLMHGAGGDEDAWSTMGRTCQIMDNLIEKKQANPMLVVMANGNANQQAAQTTMLPVKEMDRNDPAFRNAYVNSIVNDIVPYIEANYRVIAEPSDRALAGLSMGAGHTISCTLANPGFFSYICPLSNGIQVTEENRAEYDAQFQALKEAGYKLYFLACGDADFLIERARTLDSVLTENGLKHDFFVSSGGHTWSNWRIYLNTFAPMLFK